MIPDLKFRFKLISNFWWYELFKRDFGLDWIWLDTYFQEANFLMLVRSLLRSLYSATRGSHFQVHFAWQVWDAQISRWLKLIYVLLKALTTRNMTKRHLLASHLGFWGERVIYSLKGVKKHNFRPRFVSCFKKIGKRHTFKVDLLKVFPSD